MISSVKAQGKGEWIARGRLGVTGQVQESPGGQEITVSSKNNEIFLEFVRPAKAPVRLKLVGDNMLQGTIGGLIAKDRTVNVSLALLMVAKFLVIWTQRWAKRFRLFFIFSGEARDRLCPLTWLPPVFARHRRATEGMGAL